MKDDAGKILREDFAILLYANKMGLKHFFEHQNNMIRGYMRLFAKLLIEMKSHDPKIEDFADILRPEKWDLYLESILKICEYDEEEDLMNNPYNEETFVRIFRQLFTWMRCFFTQNREHQRKDDLDMFKELFEGDHEMISGKASQATKKIPDF